MLKKYILILEILVISLGSFCLCKEINDDNVIKTIQNYNKQIKAKELELQVLHSRLEAFLKELSENIVRTDVDNLTEVKKEVARLRVSLGHKEQSLRTCEMNLGRDREDESKQKSARENISSFWSQIIEMKKQDGHNSSNWEIVKQIPQQLTKFFAEN